MKILTGFKKLAILSLLAVILVGMCSTKPASAATTGTKITMYCNGGTYNGSSTYTTTIYRPEDYGLVIKSVPTRAGYVFDGWYSAKSGGTKADSSHMYTTVYAHWTLKITGNNIGGSTSVTLPAKNTSGSTYYFSSGSGTDLWFFSYVSIGTNKLECLFAPNFTGKTRKYNFVITFGDGTKLPVEVEQTARKLDINTSSKNTASLFPISFNNKSVVKLALDNIYKIYSCASRYINCTMYKNYANSTKVAYYAVDLWGIKYYAPTVYTLKSNRNLTSYQQNGLDCGMLVSAAYALYDDSGFEWLEAYNTDNCRGMLKAIEKNRGEKYTVSGINKSSFISSTQNSHKIAPGTILVYKDKASSLYGHVGLYLFNYEGNPYTIEASMSYDKNGVTGSSGQSCVRQIQNCNSATLSAYANPFYELK